MFSECGNLPAQGVDRPEFRFGARAAAANVVFCKQGVQASCLPRFFHSMSHRVVLAALAALLALPAAAQISLNAVPSRVIGQTSLAITNINPNLVEGRELLSPQSVALDTTTSPPGLYVSDTRNNRVLGFRSAVGFANGQKADIVVGQVDLVTTLPDGPGRTRTTGLTAPVGIVVDKNGNLYVADTGNNRILRFPKPFTQTTTQVPDLVIGQTGFSSRNANEGGVSATTLALSTSAGPQQVFPAFDAAGNLWVPDAGNNRVLRFPVKALGNDAAPGPEADLVLGQLDFAGNSYSATLTVSSFTSRTSFGSPSSVAFDSAGRLFVAESVSGRRSRILVFSPPFFFGQAATRLLGVNLDNAPAISETEFNSDVAQIFSLGNRIGVADVLNSRLLLFAPVEQWTSNTQYQAATQVVGQPDFSSQRINRGQGLPGPATLAGPTGAFFAGSELYVVDSGNHRVVVLPQSGSGFAPATRVIGQDRLDSSGANLLEGRELNFSNGEAGLAVDLSSSPPHLYVADSANNRVLGFNDLRNIQPGQKADIVIGQPDFQNGLVNYPTNDPTRPNSSGLSTPSGLFVDSEGNLYVADTGNGRVLRFPQPFSSPKPGVAPAADLVLGQLNFTSTITDATARTMARPYGITQVSEHGLIVSDAFHNRALLFPGTPKTFVSGQAATVVFGQADFTSTSAGSGGNQFNAPRHISSDSDDRLYVADSGNGRVQIFDHAPTALAGSFAAVTLREGLSAPRGVFVSNANGDIWVSDAGSNRALRFPNFSVLALRGFQPNFALGSISPRAVAQDAWGNLFLAESINRVTIYYPGLTAVNAANYLGLPLAPGLISAAFTTGNLHQFGAAGESSTAIPLARALNGVQLLFNSEPAPLFYAGPDQINFQVPWSAPQNGTASLQVIEVASGRILGSSTVAMGQAAPGIFTQAGDGIGAAAAQNEDHSLNTQNNPALQDSVITIYATGLGFVDGAPADGEAASKATPIQRLPQVIMGTALLPEENILYCGLAPSLVGVWQLNLKIPKTVVTLPNQPTQVIIQQNSIPSGGAALGRLVEIYVKRLP